MAHLFHILCNEIAFLNGHALCSKYMFTQTLNGIPYSGYFFGGGGEGEFS